MKKERQKIKITKVSEAELQLEINGYIEYGWTASEVRYAVNDALKAGVKKVSVYMNTAGGNVYEATEIVNQLKRLPKVEITAGALVASAGTYIMAHFPVKAYADSQFMIHKPSTFISGNEDDVKSDLKALENLTIQYREAYAKRFNKTPEEIDQMWQKDYWFNASKAKDLGLVNQIIEEEITYSPESIAMMQACGCPNIPKTQNQNNDTIMDKEKIIAALGMAADATDEQIQEKIEELRAQAENNEAQRQEQANQLVDKAIKDKRITADSKDAYVKLATIDFAETKKALESLSPVAAGSSFVNKTGKSAIDQSNWTLEDYLEKDPAAFEALMESNPEKARQLNQQYQAKK
ncbi:ATP-dependent Clp protease proteolytic subunit [Ornithobacterium rhinotracheale]|uniref:Clp protease ClpP n=1 Tax=Ornithobacterium rhinotracheale TaxID=28251 RepID=UPI001FF4C575|nr:ATP-dependent Clp protease proteolytic subunit [Ornithobacterium rhinotracheale]MCK0203574.1 ATP-dependent Clp protease proteolytic subunit [Ornithobacterium rhinotracheale]